MSVVYIIIGLVIFAGALLFLSAIHAILIWIFNPKKARALYEERKARERAKRERS